MLFSERDTLTLLSNHFLQDTSKTRVIKITSLAEINAIQNFSFLSLFIVKEIGKDQYSISKLLYEDIVTSGKDVIQEIINCPNVISFVHYKVD